DAVGGHPRVGEVRGLGMLAAVEFMENPGEGIWYPPASIAPRVAAEMMRRGVIARALPESDILGFAPPLCIDRSEVDQVADAVKSAVVAVLGP
ncbi:MAG: aspartate aminotransferase family protein, partial [Boseongicola sp.]|nr:aspartate aminotransferase family protein [Boseongicola sp.]